MTDQIDDLNSLRGGRGFTALILAAVAIVAAFHDRPLPLAVAESPPGEKKGLPNQGSPVNHDDL